MRLGWLSVVVLACAPMADAQILKVPPLKTPMIAQIHTPIVAGPSFDVNGSNNTRAQGGPSGPVALQSFELTFGNGDHKLKTVTLLRNGNVTDMKIGDNDGNDPFAGKARYLPLAAGTEVKTAVPRGVCGSHCLLDVNVPADQVFLLTGFSMVKSDGDDSVRAIEVMPHGDQGFVEVTVDNGGWNAVNVTVQYVTVPRSRVTSQMYCDGAQCNRPKPDQSALALQGFSCWKRGNGSSFVVTIGATPGSNEGSKFKDNGGDGECFSLVAGLK